MNKLYVLAKNANTYFCQRLTQEVGSGHLVFIDPWSGGTWPSKGQILVRTTAIYGGDQDLNFLKTWQGDILNPLSGLIRFRSKSSQYSFFEQMKFPILPWRAINNLSLEQLIPYFKLWGDKLLIKPDRGQGGWGIEVLTESGLKQWWKKGDHDFLLQPFMEDVREFRTFFCKGMESITIERVGPGSVANFRQGGSAKLSILKPVTQTLVDNLIKTSGVMYGSIDLFETDQGPKILELNVCPGIEQLEAISKINIIQYVIANLRT